MGDAVDELLGFGFVFGGAVLVVLEVAQGDLGVGLRVPQHGFRGLASLSGFFESLVMDDADLEETLVAPF